MSLKDLTEATVRAALEEYERLFSRLDVDGIVAGFADDARVRFSSYEPFTGKERLNTGISGHSSPSYPNSRSTWAR
jgi:ketosteroid isomerase-like protein